MANLSLPLIDQVRIASPCPKRWDDMAGDDRVRFCNDCKLHVYNLSAMGRDEAERFLHERRGEERVCAGFYRREDGTILTQDCPVGLRALRRRARRATMRAAAAIVAAFGGAMAFGLRSEKDSLNVRFAEPFRRVADELRPAPQLFTPGLMLLGDVSLPVTSAATPSDGEAQ